MKTDIEISQSADIKNIKEIAAKIGIIEDDLEKENIVLED